MRISRTLLVAAVTPVLLAGALQAQATGWVKWGNSTGPNSSFSNSPTGSGTVWHASASPYRAMFQINDPYSHSLLMPPAAAPNGFGPAVDIFCVDFVHDFNDSRAGYGAFFTNLGLDNIDEVLGSQTRSGNTLEHYLQAAWLASQVRGAHRDDLGDINGAIWQIMSGEPLYRLNSAHVWDDAGILSWKKRAQDNYGSVNASAWVVVTDQAAAGQSAYDSHSLGSQEYITYVVTPEPATLLLLGTGLLATLMAAGAVRRRPLV